MLALFGDPVARILLLAALVIRLCFAFEVTRNRLDLSGNPQLDMVFLHENAKEIASGDLRLTEPVLGNYRDIREKIYGPERYDRLFRPGTYVDSPGYLYFAALFEAVSGGSPYAVIFAQLLLDTLGCALVYLIALRVYGLAEARLALAAAALCLELVAHAGFVLRESFIAFLLTATTAAFVAGRRDPSVRTWIVAGLLWGAGWTTKLTFAFLLPFVPFIAPRKRLAAFALGAAVSIAPFVLRNVSLGVRPFEMSATSLQVLAHRNLAGYSGYGEWTGQHERIRSVLDAAEKGPLGESSAGVLAAAIEGHERGGYMKQLGAKLFWFFAPVDFYNNIAVTWLRLLSPVLRVCVVWWGLLGPFALLGFLAALRRREALPLVAAFLTLGVGTALLSGVYTRYRTPIEPIACIFFAAVVVEAARRIRAHRPSGTAIVALALLLRIGVELAIFHGPQPYPDRDYLARYVTGTFPEASARAYLLGKLR